MESRIKVNFDHETKEPYISIAMANLSPDDNDLRDEMLQKFIEGADTLPLCLLHTDGSSWGANYQLRIVNTTSISHYQSQLVGLFQNYTQNVLGLASEDQKRLYNKFFKMLHQIVGHSHLGTYYEIKGETSTPKQMTVRDYFELELTDEYKLKAFNNADKSTLDLPSRNLFDAIATSTHNNVSETPEGLDYWIAAINECGCPC